MIELCLFLTGCDVIQPYRLNNDRRGALRRLNNGEKGDKVIRRERTESHEETNKWLELDGENWRLEMLSNGGAFISC